MLFSPGWTTVISQGCKPLGKCTYAQYSLNEAVVVPNLAPFLPAPLGHEFQVSRLIILVEKRQLPTVSSLGNVVRHSRNHKPC
jgi:hypothetical protein